VLKTLQLARSELLEIVSALEFLDRGAMEMVLKHIPSQCRAAEGEGSTPLAQLLVFVGQRGAALL
jgi:hypothetical protein